MKKKFSKGRLSDFDGDSNLNHAKKGSGKDKISKKRLSIYDDYEEDDDIYSSHEKFKTRHK